MKYLNTISNKINLYRTVLTTFVLVMAGSSISYAQDDPVIEQKLQGKTNFNEIISTVKQYYSDPVTEQRLSKKHVNRSLKHWRRWEWFMSSRIGDDGNLVNYNQKLIEATGLQQNRELEPDDDGRNGTQGSSGNWSAIGPNNTNDGIGRVDRLAFHPTNANIVYVGAPAGGLWRTNNAGTSWTNLTPDLPCLGVSGIAVHPSNPNILYILTGDGDSSTPTGGGLVFRFGYLRLSIGVLKSTNGGTSWSKTGDFPMADYSSLVGYRLVMHPTDPEILFACTNQGLYRTANGGVTWNLINNNGLFYNLKFKPGSPDICYTVSLDGNKCKFFRSTDGGQSLIYYVTVSDSISNPSTRLDLAVSPSNSEYVYIISGGTASNPFVPGTFKGIFRSTDSGLNFTKRATTPNIVGDSSGGDSTNQAWYDLTIAVSNTNHNHVITGAIFIWYCPNSGDGCTLRTGYHGDIHELGFHPVDNKLWAATDGGVYSSVDNGVTWTSHFVGMNITQFYRMAVNPSNFNKMIGGSQDNGVKKRDGVSSYFDQIINNDGFTVAYDAADTSVIYAIENMRVRRYANNSNTNITPPSTDNPFAQTMAVHATAGNTLFVASDSLWITNNATNANNWIIIPDVWGGWAMRTCPSNANRVYIAGGLAYNSNAGMLRRSDNGGFSWPFDQILSAKPGFPSSWPKITFINVNPTNSNQVWITFGGFVNGVKVYYSGNAGETWVNRSGTLPNLPVNCIVVDSNNNAYIGTDNGIYYRAAGMSDWVPFYNNLPYVPVTELVISQANNKIRASTFGRGIWESDLYSTCDLNVNVTGTIRGRDFFEASNKVESDATLSASLGTKVQMRGGNEVNLKPGFTAGTNTEFRALTGACGSGGIVSFRDNNSAGEFLMLPSDYVRPSDGAKAIISKTEITPSEIKYIINQKIAGSIQLILTDLTGEIVKVNEPVYKEKIMWNGYLPIDDVNHGDYYLYANLDGRIEHMQEISINKLTDKIGNLTKNDIE